MTQPEEHRLRAEKHALVEKLLDAFREEYKERVTAPDAEDQDWYTISSQFFLQHGASEDLAEKLGSLAVRNYKYWG